MKFANMAQWLLFCFVLLMISISFADVVNAETVDIVEPKKLAPTECPHGCARWSDLAADGVSYLVNMNCFVSLFVCCC